MQRLEENNKQRNCLQTQEETKKPRNQETSTVAATRRNQETKKPRNQAVRKDRKRPRNQESKRARNHLQRQEETK